MMYVNAFLTKFFTPYLESYLLKLANKKGCSKPLEHENTHTQANKPIDENHKVFMCLDR